MSQLPDLVNVKLKGPFWSADAEVIKFANPRDNWAFRNLFIDNTPRTALGTQNLFLPGTLLALCFVKQVQVKPGRSSQLTYTWKRATTEINPKNPSLPQIKDLLRSGQLALLLLQADPDPQQWRRQNKDALPELTCLVGDINLDVLKADQNADQKLYKALKLSPPDPAKDPKPVDRPNEAGLPGALSVHGSGLSIYGQANLPWQQQRISASFQLTKLLPEPPISTPDQRQFHLAIEVERLTQPERNALIKAWKNFSGYLNPKNPLNGLKNPSETPTWVTLEIANPLTVPRLYWQISAWQEEPESLPLHFQQGEVNLILSDRQPYDQKNPPTSLARIVPNQILVRQSPNNRLQISVQASSETEPLAGTLRYTSQKVNNKWQESFTLSNLAVAFSPVETPQLLREHQDLPIPEWSEGNPVEPAVLWGCMPLEDGWAQLPVPNLTEQIYLDAKLAQVEDETSEDQPVKALLQGAISIGNDDANVLALNPNEQPWNLTLTNAQRLNGMWELEADESNLGGFKLNQIQLDVFSPDVVLNGFFWLSTGKPTAADALPNFENWISSLQSIPLTTVKPEKDLFPAAVTTTIQQLVFSLGETVDYSSVLLKAWSFSYQANQAVFKKMVDKRVLSADTFKHPLPLVWRRHASLPMIQALPLTQSQSPPNYPSPNRQLAPFELKTVTDTQNPNISIPGDWRFGVAGNNGAATWPRLLSEAEPAHEWRELFGLPLAALSIPGLILDPNPEVQGLDKDAATQLAKQYRFDLPYTDEINALAQLPKVPRNPNEVSPLPDSPPPEPPKPLTRETFAEHWERLAERANLASVDAAEAIAKQDNQTLIRHLIEPFDWPVNLTVSLDQYPGKLTLANANDSQSATIELSNETALRGISGKFTVDQSGKLNWLANNSGSESHPYQIEAGSMAAYRDSNGAFRDQRGLSRSASIQSQLIKTPVKLHEDQVGYELTSALTPFELKVTNSDRWLFWFRDLPVRTGTFSRSLTRSEKAQDVNDPGALSREQNYLAGYEWRLATKSQEFDFFPLYNLHFYPLTLEKVSVEGDRITEVEIIGRLQLPLANGGELENFSNAVRVTFQQDAASNSLQLSSVALAAEVGEWPLALQGNEVTASEAGAQTATAPLLQWRKISLSQGKDAIEIDDAELRFFLFGAEWSIQLTKLAFQQFKAKITQSHTFAETALKAPLSPKELILAIDLASEQLAHTVDLTLAVQLGNRVIDGLQVLYTFEEGSGKTIHDVSGVGTPLNLTVETAGTTTWLSKGGLAINAPTLVKSATAATKIIAACQSTNEITIEAWIKPAKFDQEGENPARLVTISRDPGVRNVTLAQGLWDGQPADLYNVRLRTNETNNDSISSSLSTPASSVITELSHVVYTRDVKGLTKIYIDGVERANRTIGGDFSNWDATFQLILANEFTGDRPWLGDYHLVAIYDRALTPAEVVQNFKVGAQGTPRSVFAAEVSLTLLGAQAGEVFCNSAYLFDDLKLVSDEVEDQPPVLLTDHALQFQWQRYELTEGRNLQLLPGMHLDSEQAPGFATLTFEVIGSQAGVPKLNVKTAFIEALLLCRWGEFLQTRQTSQQAALEQVFGSSAGNLLFGYTSQWNQQSGVWNESLLLNGFLEVKNLISWPTGMTFDEQKAQFTLPAARTKTQPQPLHHIRHTIRILFNQHPIPSDLLMIGEGQLLFNLAVNRPWQFLAVVEHQLIDVLPRTDLTEMMLGRDRRWSALQEVRLLSPQSFKHFLKRLSNTRTTEPVNGVNEIGKANFGYLEAGLRSKLAEGDAPELDQLPANTLLVEASAPQWIKQTPVAVASPTTLQFLPNGTQLAILSSPQDYSPSNPQDPQWLLLTLSFLGRLQAQANDAVQPQEPTTHRQSPLQVDPILHIHRQRTAKPTESLPDVARRFSNWGDDAPVELIISNFDTAVGRTWSRLDPLSVEENWFRLQNPLPEPQPNNLQSVMASLPDTPARLSRSVALRRAFDVTRQFYPPADTADEQLPPSTAGDRVVWRQDSLLTTQGVSSLRLPEGLQVLYTFEEGSGTTIRDVSGVSTPLDLTVKKQEATNWVSGGLAIKAPTIITSAGPATKIIDACRATSEITIEVWVKPAKTNQAGSPRIVTLSKDPGQRNFTLGQGLGANQPTDLYEVRLRTTVTNNDGLPSASTPVGSLTTNLSHVVYTRNAQGVAKIYINGVERSSRTVSGDFSKWDRDYRLALANELTENRPWLGEYHLVAIYNRALSSTEVSQNFNNQTFKTNFQEVPYNWHLIGLQILSSKLANSGTASGNRLQRHAAATLLPALLKINAQPNETPLSFAVSPYLGLEFRSAPTTQDVQLRLLSAELLCLDQISGQLLPVASNLWELQDKQTEENVRAFSLKWARETHRRLSPNSPLAILRFREINENINEATKAEVPLVTTYSFTLVSDIEQPQQLAKRVFRLRSNVKTLRFQEGQFGGRNLPRQIQPFELAPPQTTGVQPIYLTERPAATTPQTWPWGLSALRMSVQYTQEQESVIGSLGNGSTNNSFTLWWQAPQHFVQYRDTDQVANEIKNANSSELTPTPPTAGLPPYFRASAIKSLLPVLPTPPLPALKVKELFVSKDREVAIADLELASKFQRWQPVLPGTIRYLMLGDRSGAMVAVRNQLLRQSGLALNPANSSTDETAQAGETMVSGSIPVQHRIPRPVPLPTNQQPKSALQTWASYFQPSQNLLVSASPTDETFWAEFDDTPARGLQMKLQTPLHGAIPAQWDGELVFEFKSNGATANNWEITLELIDGNKAFTYNTPSNLGDVRELQLNTIPIIWLLLRQYNCMAGILFLPKSLSRFVPQNVEELQAHVSSRAIAHVLIASVRVKDKIDGFFQTLSFPLRIADETRLPLPLEPYFIQFEDPEYNRRLSSASAHASGTLKLEENSKQVLHTIRLSADRKEYNPDSLIALRYDWDDNRTTGTATLELERIVNGVPTPLLTLDKLPPRELKQLALLKIQRDRAVQLQPGEMLQIKLTIATTEILLQVNLVETPVNPNPEAAYSLLRRQQLNGSDPVECVRFAWSPEPTRIELVCAEDLRTEVVRRRAVFHWQDSVRLGTLKAYALQKIAQTGSTYFPKFGD